MAILTTDEASSYLERANSALKLTIKDAVINNSANARNDTVILIVLNSQPKALLYHSSPLLLCTVPVPVPVPYQTK
jgi:hypothetical protein